MGVFRDLFGWPGTWGTGGNMVAWVICGTLGFGWLHAKEKARHVAKLAQAARHHQDQIELLKAQHAEQMDALASHNQEMHRRMDQHADLVKAAAAPGSPAAERVVPPKPRGRM